MVQDDERVSLRARTRQVIREQVIDAALVLFGERGYDAVTMEQVADSVGMSRRTLHRYFTSKDDIVLGKYDALGGTFVELLRSRPLDESAWDSLRQVFGYSVDNFGDEELARRDATIARIIDASPALFAGYLERTQRAQGQLADVLRERAERRGQVVDPGDPTYDAVVAAACACRTVAITASASTGISQAQALEMAMGALRPTA